ncbi:MAG TPA: hypothetical protein VLZ12_14065, partial [Verrucomicrobiae bacterium]|nr:hypothetical protein [Verrucomicrobiae bacterium]
MARSIFFGIVLVTATFATSWHFACAASNEVLRAGDIVLPGNIQEKQFSGHFWVMHIAASTIDLPGGAGDPDLHIPPTKSTKANFPEALFELEIMADHTYRMATDYNKLFGNQQPSVQTGAWVLDGDKLVFPRAEPLRPMTNQFVVLKGQLVLCFRASA